MLLATLLCWFILPSQAQQSLAEPPTKKKSKLSQVDFLGAILLALSILAFLIPMEIGGVKVPWSHPAIFAMLAAGLVFALLFFIAEGRWTKNPIVPLQLLTNTNIVLSYAIMILQVGAQLGVSLHKHFY
jgi:MFS family permease